MMDAKLPLSICIIACNEERNLPRCLDSVPWAEDVLVVVDSRSRDATEAIARARGARVFVHPYGGDIEQKNYSLDQGKCDWLFILDADEAVTPELAQELSELFRGSGPSADGYEINRATYHLGRWIRHGDFYPDWQLRLLRNTCGRLTGVNPHGYVRLKGKLARLSGEILHWSYRDLADQVERTQEWSRIQSTALFTRGRRARLRDMLFRPPARFLRAYLLKQGFRDGLPGFIIATVTAFHVFLKYAKLWELERIGSSGAEGATFGKAKTSGSQTGTSLTP